MMASFWRHFIPFLSGKIWKYWADIGAGSLQKQ
jgi:hypothetical protein